MRNCGSLVWMDTRQRRPHSTACGPCERPTVTEQTSSTENPRRIVVAGGGPAAHRFADAMHARGLDGWHVTVLTEEAHLPYDRVALSTKSVAEAMTRNNAAYLKADWTKRDPAIAAELARFGRAGVPLYLVYGAKGGQPVILPSLLTEGVVVKALDAAGKS